MYFQDSIDARKQQYIDNLAARKAAAAQIATQNAEDWVNTTRSQGDAYAQSQIQQGIDGVRSGISAIRSKAQNPDSAKELINSILTSQTFKNNAQAYGQNVRKGVRDIALGNAEMAKANYDAAKARVKADLQAKGQARYQANPELFDRILNNL